MCEKLREWLLDNNQKGMDDRSMYTQMLKREKEKEREDVSIGFFSCIVLPCLVL